MTFRLRIALLSVVISGAVLLAFGAIAYYLICRERLAAVDREIRTLAYRHPGWMGSRANYERLSSVIEFVFGEERREQLILLVKDAGGRTRYISPHWPGEFDTEVLDLHLDEDSSPAPTADGGREASAAPGPGRLRGGGWNPLLFSKTPRFQTVRLARSIWRVGILGNGDDRLVVGLELADFQAELSRIRRAFLIALPLALLVIGSGGWWVAGYALRPLRSVAKVAEHLNARRLDRRIPSWGKDPEIDRLISRLNGMINRLEAGFQQAIRFSADASHELRTPLAVMQGELENALQGAAPGSTDQRVFANLLEETERLKNITRGLLVLAQADAGQLALAPEPIHLGEALGELMEDTEALADESQIRVSLNAESGLWVRADWPLLRQAVFNLLHNALRYNTPNGWIEVNLAARHDQVDLQVCNGGPGIPAADQPRVFDRFFRADAARSRRVDGAGLGLSLAREIVIAHQGTLSLKESRPGRTCFVLTLPRANPPDPIG